MSARNKKPSKVGAILIGLVEIAITLLCALMGVLMMFVPNNNPALAGGHQILLIALLYLLCGAFFLTFGVGTIMGKRWARTLMLICSWFWLACGIFTLGNLIYTWPGMKQSFGALEETQPGMVLGIEIVMAVFFVIFFLLLPGMFILFYGRKKAKTNFESWDPKKSWTDQCPAPVLALSLCTGLGAFCLILVMPFFNFLFCFFGIILVGWPGALLSLALAAILIYVTWGAYHLKMRAWWILLVTYLFWGVSWVLTCANHTMSEIDEMMGMDVANLKGLKNMDYFNDTRYWSTYMGMVFGIYIAYMFFIRKYFKQAGKRK